MSSVILIVKFECYLEGWIICHRIMLLSEPEPRQIATNQSPGDLPKILSLRGSSSILQLPSTKDPPIAVLIIEHWKIIMPRNVA
ncbi:hypothetical protein HN51_061613 [Arachis hypogaea]